MFEVGQIYNRRNDIHGKYKGQQYGGIATPADHPYIFIFTSDAGAEYGYHDGYGGDDTFWYTGEGQTGNMEMIKGNLAIRDHAKNNKEILLFESEETGFVRFVGKCEYIGNHREQRPDKNNDLRSAIIFHLNIKQANNPHNISDPSVAYDNALQPKKSLPLNKLRELCVASYNDSKTESIQSIQKRSLATKYYALKRASQSCEGCRSEAPFNTKKGPYLEVHHLYRLADGGPDLPENVIALCPNCHRRVHYSSDAKEYNHKLINIVTKLERNVAYQVAATDRKSCQLFCN